MHLIHLENISMAYGHVALLDHAGLRLEKGERVCLLGRNGEGKSTLLKIINGEIKPDDGKIDRMNGLRVGRLAQEPEFTRPDMSVFECVAAGLGALGGQVTRYHELVHRLEHEHDNPKLFQELEEVQHQLEAGDGWRLEQRVETVLSRLDLPADAILGELSGGWKRRVALAQVLVSEPDLLLLDEPTNHLDIASIQWLEQSLLEFNGGVLFVSHDRAFVRALATRLVELDRGVLRSYPGNYDTYLATKQAELAVETDQAAKFDKKLAQEEAWIRQGVKARRTRNEGRVRALEQLRLERAARRNRGGEMKVQLEQAERSGKLVAEAENISKSYADKRLVDGFSCTVLRGDRIGLIGPNGAGKTTLLKLLLGDLAPDSGEIRHGTKLQVAYFDQLRAQLDPEQSVYDCVSQGSDSVTINGKTKHVMSYLADFLFSPQRARSPIKTLSGGERNRLLLARLFTKPANLLVMDEPTNDLDVESLELLEELLADYSGTLLLVSHDRAFLDNVVTASFVFEGNGRVQEYVGGYSDWLRQRPAPAAPPAPAKPAAAPKSAPAPAKPRKKPSYKEQREIEELPKRIEQLEQELGALQANIADPGFYRQEAAAVNTALQRMAEIEQGLQTAYARWETLENEYN